MHEALNSIADVTMKIRLYTGENLEPFQYNISGTFVDAPWYVPNTVIRKDLQTPTLKEEIQQYSSSA
jgi:hypothetical protein